MPAPTDPYENKVKICDRPCPECPFVGGLKLRPGRLQEIIRETKQGGQFPCHKAIYEKRQNVLCAGWDKVVRPNATRMAERFGILVEVDLDTLPKLTGAAARHELRNVFTDEEYDDNGFD
jgi:hypothetical protein